MHTSHEPVGIRNPRRFVVSLVTAVVLSLLFFTLLYFFNNKYTYKTPQPENGFMKITDASFAEQPFMFLTDGWGVYYDRLLTPEEAEALTPDAYIHIGQYEDMRFGRPGTTAHGYATYHLCLDVSGHSGSNIYTLQLPEVYSAYRLYINGELKIAVGVPEEERYEPCVYSYETTFSADDRIDILIAVADWSNYTSGLVSSPAFGDPIAIDTMVQSRLVWSAALIGAALMLGIVIILAAASLRRKPGILFLILILFFIGFSSYSIIHALVPSGMFWFWFKTFCYYALFFLAIWLIGELCHIHTWLSITVKVIDCAMCVLSIGIPILFQGHHTPMYLFHEISHLYKYFLLVYLSVAVFKSLLHGHHFAAPVLCGLGVFASAAVVGLIFGHMDPITFGEPVEIACFIMICIMGAAMIADSIFRHRHLLVWHHGHYDEVPEPPIPAPASSDSQN